MSIIRKIDDNILGGNAKKLYKIARDKNAFDAVRGSTKYRSLLNYNKHQSHYLSALCEKYGSDKGAINKTDHPFPWPAHTYTDIYGMLFDHCRHSVKKVFECGLGTNNPDLLSSMGVHGKPGASLRVWRDYFPNALIVGADIDTDILFSEDRIQTYFLDQTDPVIIADFWKQAGTEFDFMVDDGLHQFNAGICLFENSIKHMADCGVYIIEDVTLPDMVKYKDYFENTDYQVMYINCERPGLRLIDNNLVLVRNGYRA